MDVKPGYVFRSRRVKALALRIAAHLALAVLALSLPVVGPNRFLLAGVLLVVSPPVAILLNAKLDQMSRNWAEALFDLLLVVTLVHLVPHLWMVAMCLGLMVALAPSVSLHPASHRILLLFGIILLLGMTFAALAHAVPGWQLVIAAVAATYPAMLYYSYTQSRSANELRQRAQLMKGMVETAGSVAHDFNNMLMGVSGHAELALQALPDDHAARTHISEVLSGAQRASQLSNQLMNFAGRSVDRVEHVDLMLEFRLIARLLRSAVVVQIEIDAPATPLYISANVSQLHQVLMNILLNAAEAMQGVDAKIEVTVRRVSSGDGAAQVEMRIADRGHGIFIEDSMRLFDPRYSTKEEGRGLGLAGVKRIMDAYQGTIDIADREGGGTVVQLRWPEAAPTSAEPATGISAAASAAQHGTVDGRLALVVDDDEKVRAVIGGLLENLGYTVLTAGDADAAMRTFTQRHAELYAVILDLKMPGKDGWSCLGRIRSISPTMPVVICSGYNSQAQLPAAADDDPNLVCLNKPFRGDELAQAVHSLVM